MARDRLTGNALQKAIIDLAHMLGWRAAHFPAVLTKHGWRTPVAADGKGFPDLLLVRDRVVAIEVKGDGDRMRPEQKEWMSAFALAGVEALVVTPRMWEAGAVEEVLSRRRPA